MDITAYEKLAANRQQVESEQQSFRDASEQRQRLQEESRKTLAAYYDKILFYSASAFSFTIALVGLVIGDKTNALSKVGLLVPNVFWLYSSWFAFLSACICVLASKKLDSYYISHFGAAHYAKKYKAFEMERLDYYAKHPETVITVDMNKEDFVRVTKQNIATLDTAQSKAKKSRDRYYLAMLWAGRASEVLILLGVLSLLMFSLQLTQAIIWV